MIGLTDGIEAKFTTAGLQAAITGGLWAGEYPERGAMPYAVYHIITPGFEQAYTGSAMLASEEIGVQFDVIGTGYRDVGALCEALATAYRTSVVAATAGTNYHVHQTSAVFPDADTLGKNEDSVDVWAWHVSFVFGVC